MTALEIGVNINEQFEVPVLLCIFNRPEKIKRVLSELLKIQPKYLFIAADGPRLGNSSDVLNTTLARNAINGINWDCEIKTLYQEKNLGCRRGMTAAIDWFFENVESGIILEDDCIPHESFFKYAEELLNKYQSDERVMSIGAQHFHGASHQLTSSYFFSKFVHCWGWATWRRSWDKHDHEMACWTQLRNSDWLLQIGNGSRLFKKYWENIFDRCDSGEIDSWAYRWTLSCWSQGGLSILPSKNLVTNIGFDNQATHTSRGNSVTENLPLEAMEFPLKHPYIISADYAADLWTAKHVFDINCQSFLTHLVISMPGGKLLQILVQKIKILIGKN